AVARGLVDDAAADGHGRVLRLGAEEGGLINAVIPGRPQGEPGIHRAAVSAGPWIPGSRYASPGMTGQKQKAPRTETRSRGFLILAFCRYVRGQKRWCAGVSRRGDCPPTTCRCGGR